MGPLRIAVVTPELPSREYPHRGRSVYETLRHLAAVSDLQVFCPLPRYPAHFRPRRYDYRKVDLTYSLPGVSAHFFEYPAFPIMTRPFNGYTCAHFLEPQLREFQPDVILNFFLYPAGFAALNVGRKLSVPVVVGSLGSDLNAIPDPFSRWLTRKTINGASRVITKSRRLRDLVVTMGADPLKTHVVENGCDENLFFVGNRREARLKLSVSQETELVAFIGRMHRAKGVHELLDAVAILSQKRADVHLVYVGDGPEMATLQDRVNASRLAKHVSFAGAATSAEVALWLAAADVFTLPSYSEGCPNAVLEALSCGRPVVATDVGAIPDLVNSSCGVLVPVGQVEPLEQGLNRALNTKWDENLIAQGFRRSWKQVAQETLEICTVTWREARA